MRDMQALHRLFRKSDPAQPERLPAGVRVIHNPRARRMALRLDPGARCVNLVIPRGMSSVKAHDFARQNASWIRQQLQGLAEPVPFTDGAEIPLLGARHRLKINYDSTLKKTDIYLKNKYIITDTNKLHPQQRITRFLKSRAGDYIKPAAREKAGIIGEQINAITLRDPKTRWGSCTENGRLSFSWRLIFAPYAAFDYVIAHEVAHLMHLNHSPDFWATCRDLCQDYETGKAWMRAHGHTLLRYGTSPTPTAFDPEHAAE